MSQMKYQEGNGDYSNDLRSYDEDDEEPYPRDNNEEDDEE